MEGGGSYGFAAPLPNAHTRLAGILLLRPLQLGYAVNWLPADDNPETLDLTLRADVVDAGGKDFDYCEQEGMGEDHNLYIIDEIAETFYVV